MQQQPNGAGGHASALDMQRLQQQLQAQYNRNGGTGQPGGFSTAATNQALTPGAAFAMMQQQQQQPLHPSAATNPGMSGMLHSGMWNSQQQQQQPMAGNESSLDASTGSSARLMAMVGMNAPGSLVGGANAVLANNPSLSMQNMQAILQQQQQQQQLNNQAALTGNFQQAQQQILQQQQGKQQNALFPPQQQQPQQAVMLGGFGGGMNLQQQQQVAQHQQQQPPLDAQQQSQQPRAPGVTASQQILFQQQFANLQKQIQQGGTTAVAANAAVVALRNAAANLQMQQGGVGQAVGVGTAGTNPLLRQPSLQQQAQQPFYMQQQQPQANDPSASSSLMHTLQRPGPFPGAPTGHGLGMRSVSSQASLNGAQQQQAQTQPATLTEQHLRLHQQQQQALMQQRQQQQPGLGQETAPWQQPQYGTAAMQSQQTQQSSLQDASQQPQPSSGNGGGDNASTQQQQSSGNDTLRSYLSGNFVGDWQSNADLPDRRRVIFQILDVIRMMRPENTKMNDK